MGGPARGDRRAAQAVDPGAPQGLVQGSDDRSCRGWRGTPISGKPRRSAPIDAETKPELLRRSRLQRAPTRTRRRPTHPFFDAADALLAARAAVTGANSTLARLRLLRDLIDTVGPDLRQRKRERRVISFDDMLYNLYAALEGGEHPELVAVAAREVPGGADRRIPGHRSAAVRDLRPHLRQGQGAGVSRRRSQAGDLQLPQRRPARVPASACKASPAAYTLADNQRSTQGLIEALNGLFSTNSNAFMLEGLDYHPVAMGNKARKPFADSTAHRADLQVWTLPPTPDGEPIPKTTARPLRRPGDGRRNRAAHQRSRQGPHRHRRPLAAARRHRGAGAHARPGQRVEARARRARTSAASSCRRPASSSRPTPKRSSVC